MRSIFNTGIVWFSYRKETTFTQQNWQWHWQFFHMLINNIIFPHRKQTNKLSNERKREREKTILSMHLNCLPKRALKMKKRGKMTKHRQFSQLMGKRRKSILVTRCFVLICVCHYYYDSIYSKVVINCPFSTTITDRNFFYLSN